MYIQNLIEIHRLIHKILNINKMLLSIKGHNSVENKQKMCKHQSLHLVNINEYTKFDQFLSIHSVDIEQKQNFDINQEP